MARAMRRILVLMGLALTFLGVSAPSQAAQCEFVLGFKALHDQIPGIVGGCLVNEHHNPANGDALQETTGATGRGGLLVWRKANNWTAYTDGYRTWVSGPHGLQERLNTQRFPWEGDQSHGAAPPASMPGSSGQHAMTVYRVTNPNATELMVEHTVTDGAGFSYAFWTRVPAHGTTTIHLRDIPQIPSPFHGSVALHADKPFTSEVAGYDDR